MRLGNFLGGWRTLANDHIGGMDTIVGDFSIVECRAEARLAEHKGGAARIGLGKKVGGILCRGVEVAGRETIDTKMPELHDQILRSRR